LKLLVARAGALGDVILLRPALHALRHAGHEVVLLAPASSARVLQDEVDAWRDWEGPELRALLAGSEDALGPFDGALLVSRSQDLALAVARCADQVRRVDAVPDDMHAARHYVDAVEGWADFVGVPPPLRLDGPTPAEADALLDALPVGFLSVHPGSGSSAKNWALFPELVFAMAPSRFLLVEGPADATAAAPLRELPGAVHARDLDLRTLAAVLRQAGVHVGNDSGISHLAAACGTPTVAVFGPTDPHLWAPIGPRVRVVRVSSGELHEIGADVVAAAARSLGWSGA
jgi:ADP-heptose:LPS heptosyltransferase